MLNCRWIEGLLSLRREGRSETSTLSSEKVIAGCFCVDLTGVGVSSLAGGGGGATVSEVEEPPSGPRGSDSRSSSSRRETTDCARREVVGRRREDCGEARVDGWSEGVEADMEGLVGVEDPFVEVLRGGADDANGSDDTATRSSQP